MTMAWTKGLTLGLLLWPLGCVVSVDDDPGPVGGSGGTFGGDSGSSGDGGTSAAGFSGSAGSGGSSFPAPTCDPEPIDDGDECVQCFKRNCCEEWLGCDDQSCTDEWIYVAECLVEEEVADEEALGMCISESSAAGDDFVQSNTQALIDCALSSDDTGFDTRCSSECFGTDIFYE